MTQTVPLRVLWFTDWQPHAVRRRLGLEPFPGPQAWVDSLAAALSAQPGMELAVAVPAATAFAPFDEDGVRYVHLYQPWPASRAGRVVRGWRHRLTPQVTLSAAARLVHDHRPDVVHVHGTENGFGLLASSSPVPFVISLQGILWLYQRAYFSGRSLQDMATLVCSPDFIKGRGLVHDYLRMRRMAAREIEIMRGGRFFIGRTHWDQGALTAVNPAATYYHCDEIMRPQFYGPEWRPDEHHGARVYSTSGALLFKGTECLLESAAILRRRGHTDLRVRIAGTTAGAQPEGLYRRAARRLGIEDSVEWLGRLEADGIVRELLAADMYAYPSHIDNSPNALVEAMLCGVPTAATCTGGIPSLMHDGVEGLLVPRGDPVSLAAALEQLLADRERAAGLGAAARALALARNDGRAIAARMLGIYGEIVAEAKHQPRRQTAKV